MNNKDTITRGSGNVFADLGFPKPEEHQIKAGLVSRIADIIEERHMAQVQAAEVFDIDQPKVVALLHGRFRGFSVYQLLCLIAALGHDVEVVTKKPSRRMQSEKAGYGTVC